jgi:hypothetical protein
MTITILYNQVQYWQTKAIGVAANEPLATTVARSGNCRGIGGERAARCRRWTGQPKTGFAEVVGDDFPIFHAAIMRSYDSAGNVIETHQHAGEFREP